VKHATGSSGDHCYDGDLDVAYPVLLVYEPADGELANASSNGAGKNGKF
jgi:hypothetical protein